MSYENATMADLAKSALSVQDACNLSGVVISFAEVVKRVRVLLREAGQESTDNINTNPVCVMYSSKIASLTGSNLDFGFREAYKACKQLASE